MLQEKSLKRHCKFTTSVAYSVHQLLWRSTLLLPYNEAIGYVDINFTKDHTRQQISIRRFQKCLIHLTLKKNQAHYCALADLPVMGRAHDKPWKIPTEHVSFVSSTTFLRFSLLQIVISYIYKSVIWQWRTIEFSIVAKICQLNEYKENHIDWLNFNISW